MTSLQEAADMVWHIGTRVWKKWRW